MAKGAFNIHPLRSSSDFFPKREGMPDSDDDDDDDDLLSVL